MFEKLKKWLSPDTPDLGSGETGAPKQPEVKKKSAPKKPELTDKEKATAAGEPYIAITSVEIDPNDINNGSFDLDWNDKFILNLVKQGYRIKKEDTDAMIVDRWFHYFSIAYTAYLPCIPSAVEICFRVVSHVLRSFSLASNVRTLSSIWYGLIFESDGPIQGSARKISQGSVRKISSSVSPCHGRWGAGGATFLIA